MEQIMTMFATFVAFCGGVVVITETINRLFKVEGTTAKLIVSWVMSLGLAALGFGLKLGIFADCGAVNEWQGWVKAELIGFFCAICSNKAYDMNEIWRLIQIIFSFFNKDGKAIRAELRSK